MEVEMVEMMALHYFLFFTLSSKLGFSNVHIGAVNNQKHKKLER